MGKKKFLISDRLKSFKYAFQGFKPAIQEHNMYIHIVAACIVVVAGFYYALTVTEWFAIAIVIGLVFISEFFNTAIEYLANAITQEHNENIKKAKDIAAAAVLISAIIAVVVGLIIFLPKIIV